MHIAEFTCDDLQELKELQPEGWNDITDPFVFYTSFSFCAPVKIIMDGAIVGVGASIHHKSTAWLAHIIVHKDYRNRGIGTKITQRLIDGLNKAKCRTINLIATQLGEPVYRKFGFQKETEYHFFKNETPINFNVNGKYIQPANASFYNDILALDKATTGEDRASLLMDHLPGTIIYSHGTKLLAFYMSTLGEGLIISLHRAAGIELLKHRLQTKTFSILPQENKSAIAFLEKSGFNHHRSGSRMRLGQEITFKGEMLFNRIGGNLG